MSKIIYQDTKTLKVKDNNQSADGISPNYIYGCLGGCMNSYCYVARYNRDKIYVNQNVDEIHKAVEDWVETKPWLKVPNQQDPFYYTVDIGCNTDIALHQKHLKMGMYLMGILDFYTSHPKLKPTFATKYPSLLKDLQVDGFDKKPRVRVSLMPHSLSHILEPYTEPIRKRIDMISELYYKGWEVHVNFSPVILSSREVSYAMLFQDMIHLIPEEVIRSLKYEVIFMTMHPNNIKNAYHRITNSEHKEDYLSLFNSIIKPITEVKNDKGVMRYPLEEKRRMIGVFKSIFQQYFSNYYSLNEAIRYIF